MADDEIDSTEGTDDGDVEGLPEAPPTEALQIVEATPVEPLTPLDLEPAVIEPPVIEPAADLPVAEAVPPSGLTPQQKRMALIGGAVAAVLLLVIVIVAGGGGDDEKSVTPGSTTTTEVDASTTTEPTNTSTTAVDTSTTAGTAAPPTGSTAVPFPDPAQNPVAPRLQLNASTAVLSLDGAKVIIADNDRQLLAVHDARTGSLVSTLDGSHPVFGGSSDEPYRPRIAVSSDGDRVAAIQDDLPGPSRRGFVVWDAANGALIGQLPTESEFASPLSVSFNPTDPTQVLVFTDRSVEVWDTTFATRTVSIQNEIRDAAYTPDGTRVVVVESTTISLIDTGTGETLSTVPLPVDESRALTTRISPDGTKVLTSGRFTNSPVPFTVFDVASGAPLFTATALFAVFGDDNATVITDVSQESATVLDSSTGAVRQTLTLPTTLRDMARAPIEVELGPPAALVQADLSADGRVLAVEFETHSWPLIAVWDLSTQELLMWAWGEGVPVLNADGKVLTTFGGNTVSLYAV